MRGPARKTVDLTAVFTRKRLGSTIRMRVRLVVRDARGGRPRTLSDVVPLDRRGGWYRYHHLFGELLGEELERTEPELVSALNARAMTWCMANDLPEEAIGYGQAAGETDAVAGLIGALSPPLYYDGRLQTLEEWLGWFGDGGGAAASPLLAAG